nr:hypothetical protein [Mycetohabitans sp. B8]
MHGVGAGACLVTDAGDHDAHAGTGDQCAVSKLGWYAGQARHHPVALEREHGPAVIQRRARHRTDLATDTQRQRCADTGDKR